MREQILRDFFAGETSADLLAQDMEGAVTNLGSNMLRQKIEDMDGEFSVLPEHLVRICDAVLAGNLSGDALEAIGFCLISSDTFEWDTDTEQGNLVGEVLFDWSAPEINYPLTETNVREWRKTLRGEEAKFERQ